MDIVGKYRIYLKSLRNRIAMLSLQVKILYYAGTMNILDTMTFFVK